MLTWYLIGTGSTAYGHIFPKSSLFIWKPVKQDNIYEADSFGEEKWGVVWMNSVL